MKGRRAACASHPARPGSQKASSTATAATSCALLPVRPVHLQQDDGVSPQAVRWAPLATLCVAAEWPSVCDDCCGVCRHALMSLLPDNLGLSASDTLLMVVPACHANACAAKPAMITMRMSHAAAAVFDVI